MINSGTFWFCLVLSNWGLWIALVVQSHRLYRAFCSKFPMQAQTYLPLSYGRHPEKFNFFYRRSSQVFLKSDGQLRKLKTQLDVILCAVIILLEPV